jgi:hypothetical protein
MTFKIGASAINKMQLGGVEIKKALLGSTVIYNKVAAATIAANLLTSGGGVTNLTSITTASITIAAGRPVIVAFFQNSYNSGTALSATCTGAGQTWTRIRSASLSGTNVDYDRIHAFTSPGTAGSGTLTITPSGQLDAWAYVVIELQPSSGTASLGTLVVGSDNTNSSSNSVTLPSANYWVAMTFCGGWKSGVGLNITPKSGWTEVGEALGADSNYWFAAVEVALSAAGESTTAQSTYSFSTSNCLWAIPVTVA